MAFSTLKECRSLSIRTLASSTTPKLAARVSSAKMRLNKDIVAAGGPIAIIGVVAVLIVFHTGIQQMFRSPSVQVTKTRRECVPEVDLPDAVIKSAHNFHNKSFFRKVAHIQDKDYTNYTQVNPFSRSRKCDTLKTVGVPTKED